MIKYVIFTLCVFFFVSCSTLPTPEPLGHDLFCSRKMGHDFREFTIKLKVTMEKSSNERSSVRGQVTSLWKNNPIAGQFVDKVVGSVYYLKAGELFRLKSQNKGAYFYQLDAWTGKHNLIRSRFNKKGSSYRTLRCKKLH